MPSRLKYVSDTDPGLRRQRAGRGFAYRDAEGKVVKDRETLDRIRMLAIPPAYERVWICSDANGHLQATGIDARGRKQYRYHEKWSETQSAAKFAHLNTFARVLPEIRATAEYDLKAPAGSKRRLLATAVLLLDLTLIRIGNERYAEENKSFGLTTLLKRHVEIAGTQVVLDFRAKSGQQRHVAVRDRRLANVLRTCQELPGQRLFQYFDEAGERQLLDSRDVNEYLQALGGPEVSAKDYRTWAGTLFAGEHLIVMPEATSPTAAKRLVAQCMKRVSSLLGNTPTVCRASYVHPAIIEHYATGKLPERWNRRGPPRQGLSEAESALARYLENLG